MITWLKEKVKSLLFRILSAGNKPELTTVGNWTLSLDSISRESFVVSAGAGTNIQFEEDLAKIKECHVHLYDPTPTGIEFMKSRKREKGKIIFHEVGLAGSSGKVNFGFPDRAEEGSYRVAGPGEQGEAFPCKTVGEIFAESGREKIDVLKIDIEGFEYPVIDEFLKSKVPISQLLVEFHTNKQISISQGFWSIVWCLIRLRLRGFRLVNIFKSDFTLIRHI